MEKEHMKKKHREVVAKAKAERKVKKARFRSNKSRSKK